MQLYWGLYLYTTNECLNYILQLFIKAYICMCVFSFFLIGHMMEMTLVCLCR